MGNCCCLILCGSKGADGTVSEKCALLSPDANLVVPAPSPPVDPANTSNSSQATVSTCPIQSQQYRTICRVGYAMNSKKLRKSSNPDPLEEASTIPAQKKIWRGGGLADILESSHGGVTFEAFDYDPLINMNQKFDVIIHKLTEDVESSKAESIRKIDSVTEYLKRNPRTVIVDPLPAVRTVVSRERTTLRLQDLVTASGADCPFRQPKFAIALSPDSIKGAVRKNNLSFPVICKPIEACGTPNAHAMVVAVSEEGLALVSCPCVIQEYIDHDGRFYKVYVIDKEVMVFQRNSLPNLCSEERPSTILKSAEIASECRGHSGNGPIRQSRSLAFDSRYKYPTFEDFYEHSICDDSFESAESHLGPSNGVSASTCSPARDAKAGRESEKYVSEVRLKSGYHIACDFEDDLRNKFLKAAEIVSQGFALSLYGFDVIIPTQDRETADDAQLVIIDINFFPSYKEISDFPQKLCNYMRKRAGLDDETAAGNNGKSKMLLKHEAGGRDKENVFGASGDR